MKFFYSYQQVFIEHLLSTGKSVGGYDGRNKTMLSSVSLLCSLEESVPTSNRNKKLFLHCLAPTQRAGKMQFCLFVKWEISELGTGIYAYHLEYVLRTYYVPSITPASWDAKMTVECLLAWNNLQSKGRSHTVDISLGMNMSPPITYLTSTIAFHTR